MSWYLKRLRTMSIAEVAYRVKSSFVKNLDRRSKIGFIPSGHIHDFPKSILHLPKKIDPIDITAYPIFGNLLHIDDSINWHMDIMNKKEFPKKFSFSIDTRTGKYGNVKVVWEINRLQFLSAICLQYQQSDDSRYLDLFMNIIISWKEANPYLLGVNWYSNIEVNIRIINWFLCWELLQVNQIIAVNKKFKKFVEEIWLPLIELHGIYAARYESKYSSSNNHLIAEACGLFIIGSYWSFKKSTKWQQKGKVILEKEIQKQHSANGINKEEASEYIQFITDFLLMAHLVGASVGEKFSPAYESTLRNIFEYIYHLMDISGNVPYYGDDDDGKLLWLNFGNTINNFHSLLTSGAIIFNDSKFKSRVPLFDLKNQILFGIDREKLFNNIPVQKTNLETKNYKNEGHFFIKKGNSKSEIYLHMDVAPLGYLSIAAHGHADALSFILNVDGRPYIIDPGTYSYHSYPEWREYFKGTIAHNTIRVDGLNQATNGGPCLWVDHYRVTLLQFDDTPEKVFIKGSHDGYKKIGVAHIRSITFDKASELITIRDELKSSGTMEHKYEFPLHLHPDILLSELGRNDFEMQYPGKRTVRVCLDNKLTSRIVHGSKNPILGWFSPSFLQKQPTTVIYNSLMASGDIELESRFYIC